MKVLAITGTLAESTIRKYAAEIENEVDVDVISLPISVAAFITPEYAAKYLQKTNLKKYDMILMPGSVQGDMSIIEKSTGVLTFKGPIHAADLSIAFMNGLELSKTVPASEIAINILKEKTRARLGEIKKNWKKYVNENTIIIGQGDSQVPLCPTLPIPVIAEIVNAPIQNNEAIIEKAEYYERQGASIIDIGMIAGRPEPSKVNNIIALLRDTVKVPLSIDTLNVEEIKAAIDSDIDLVLSLDSENIKELHGKIAETPAVILPGKVSKGELDRSPQKRVSSLIKTVKEARRLGVSKVIADPVLEPAIIPGIMNSLRAYQLYREKDEQTPTLFGLGNVTELIDIDSIGVNGILTAIAYELNSSLIFTPEFSIKAKGSVKELVNASEMIFLSKEKGIVPKDIGIDLLVIKEKKWIEEPYLKLENIKVIEAKKDDQYKPDQRGWFKIQVDRRRKLIEAIFYKNVNGRPETVIRGEKATNIYQTIVRENLISKLEHSAYLGRELEKAEIALKLDRSYIQDYDLF